MDTNMKGLTLIEMIATIALFGILAGVALVILNYRGMEGDQSGVSFGVNGFTEVRCIAGYEFVIGNDGNSRQVMDEMGYGVKCR